MPYTVCRTCYCYYCILCSAFCIYVLHAECCLLRAVYNNNICRSVCMYVSHPPSILPRRPHTSHTSPARIHPRPLTSLPPAPYPTRRMHPSSRALPPMPAQISSDDSDRRVVPGALRGARRPSPSRTTPTGLDESYRARVDASVGTSQPPRAVEREGAGACGEAKSEGGGEEREKGEEARGKSS